MLWFYADSQDAPKIKVWLLVVVTGLITQSFLAIFPFLSHLLHFLPLFPESTSQINYFPCIPVSGSSRAIQREYRYHCKCFRKCLLTQWRVAWRRDREEAPVVLVEGPAGAGGGDAVSRMGSGKVSRRTAPQSKVSEKTLVLPPGQSTGGAGLMRRKMWPLFLPVSVAAMVADSLPTGTGRNVKHSDNLFHFADGNLKCRESQ